MRRTKVILHLFDKDLWFTTGVADPREREPARARDPKTPPTLIQEHEETPHGFRSRVNREMHRQQELHGARIRREFERTDLR